MQRGGPPITKSLGMMPATPIRVPTPPPPPNFTSNAPNPFYRQHHVVEAPAIDEREFRPAWRVKTKLMVLHEAGKIDRRQFEAAAVFKQWCESVGKQRTSDLLAVRVDGGRRPDELIGTAQIEAARRLASATLALGNERIRVLCWLLLDDLLWTELAKRLGLAKATAICRVTEAIAALSLWRAGEPVPAPPRTRPRIEPRRW